MSAIHAGHTRDDGTYTDELLSQIYHCTPRAIREWAKRLRIPSTRSPGGTLTYSGLAIRLGIERAATCEGENE